MVGISGSLGAGYQDVHAHGIDALSSIVPGPMSLGEAFEGAAALIADAAEQVMRLINVGGTVFNRG